MSLRIHLSLLSVLLLNNCNNKKESVATVINETVIFETKLSKKIDETSGLEYFNEGLITHNDSGDDAKLYLFSQTGELLEEFVVNDAVGVISLSSFNSFAIPGYDFSIDLTNAFLPIGSKSFILFFALFLT